MVKDILSFTIAFFVIWSITHVSFFYRSLNGKEHNYFWPIDENASLAGSYDFTELLVYVVIPAVILLLLTQWYRKKEQMED